MDLSKVKKNQAGAQPEVVLTVHADMLMPRMDEWKQKRLPPHLKILCRQPLLRKRRNDLSL